MQFINVALSIHNLFIGFLFLSLLSCAVPVKVDVDQAQLIPREQAQAFLKTIKLDKKYSPKLYKEYHLEYVQWNNQDRIPYKDLDVFVNSFMGDYNIFLQHRDEKRFPNDKVCLIYSLDPPMDSFGKKVINALVSLGAGIKN